MKLKEYQITGVNKKLEILSKYNAVYNAYEMGLGKTAMTIACLKELKPKNVLIVCPASLVFNWSEEFFNWNNELEEYIQVITSSKDKYLNKKITIVSYSLIINNKIHSCVINHKPEVIVFDEAHYLKNIKSKRSSTCLSLSLQMKAKTFFLSGTPLTNRPLDLFPICQFFTYRGLRNADMQSYWPYVKRYCNAKPGRFGWDVTGASNLEELKKYLSLFMVREEKKNVMKELPSKIYRTIPIIFDTEKARNYAIETKQLIADDGSEINLEKLKFEEHIAAARKILGELKVKAAAEYIKSLLEEKQKIVVFAWHKNVIDGLKEQLIDFVSITGDSSSSDRQRAVSEFQNNSNIKLFIGNIAAAGIGITLTAADHVVMVEHDWTPALNEQAEDRIHRIGQERVCIIDYLVVKNSLEQKVYNLIKSKKMVIDEVIRAA